MFPTPATRTPPVTSAALSCTAGCPGLSGSRRRCPRGPSLPALKQWPFLLPSLWVFLFLQRFQLVGSVVEGPAVALMQVRRRILLQDEPHVGAAVDVEMHAGDPPGLTAE